jgi:hypothetical protein
MKESVMAKGQKHSNREVRKPKAIKAPAEPATAGLLTKGMLSPPGTPKKPR